MPGRYPPDHSCLVKKANFDTVFQSAPKPCRRRTGPLDVSQRTTRYTGARMHWNLYLDK
jgi:hypothetical protein